jgi:hypothetical protein
VNRNVLDVEMRRAVVGDTLVDRGNRLDLPVEHVLPTHAAPAGRDALDRALAT